MGVCEYWCVYESRCVSIHVCVCEYWCVYESRCVSIRGVLCAEVPTPGSEN